MGTSLSGCTAVAVCGLRVPYIPTSLRVRLALLAVVAAVVVVMMMMMVVVATGEAVVVVDWTFHNVRTTGLCCTEKRHRPIYW